MLTMEHGILMTFTVPTWTLVLPLIVMVMVLYVYGMWKFLTWLHKYLDRFIARRLGLEPEE